MSNYKNILRDYLRDNSLNCSLGEISDFEQIGEGGNGLVFAGKLYEQPVAIKFLINPAKRKLTRFKAEYLNVSLLPESKFIVRPLLYEEFDIAGELYPAILMKKQDGHLVRPDTPTAENIDKVLRFLVAALKFIHSQGIIHRDLKPENILINDGVLALSDFGIAYYNPEIFKLRAETRKTERIANRLFSAPEQEESNIPAHPTMDIYALGQICHWYGIGSVHRGTNRVALSNTIPNTELFDFLIEKCLAQRPENRFQTIGELADTANKFLENRREDKGRNIRNKTDPMKFLHPFGMALGASFPKGISKASFTDDKKILNRLITNIAKFCNFEHELWWLDSEGGSMFFNFIKLDDDTWLMGRNEPYKGLFGEEARIKSAWVYHDTSYYSDIVLLNLEAMPPFGIYEGDTVKENDKHEQQRLAEYQHVNVPYRPHIPSEEAALVDDKFYVSRQEYDNGFAEVEGEVIDLSEHNVSLRLRHLKERSLFVTTQQHTIFRRKSEDEMLAFLNKYNAGAGITEEILLEFIHKIRKNRYENE